MLPPLRPSNVRPISSASRPRSTSSARRDTGVVTFDNVRPIRPDVRAQAIELRARPMVLAGDDTED